MKHAGNPSISFGTATLSEGIVRLFREGSTGSDAETSVAQDDGTMLAVLAIPIYMTPADFLTYVAPADEGLAHLRLVRYSVNLQRLLVATTDMMIPKGYFRKPLDCSSQI